MDYNYLLLFSMMPTGRYNVYRKRFEMKVERVLLNRFCIGACFFCAAKLCLIIAIPLQSKPILYFVEGCHLTTFYMYLYMAGLCKDGPRMDCLRFMFIPNLTDLCRCYYLDARATKKFLKTAGHIRHFIYLVMLGFEIAFIVFIGRCLVIAYFEIEIKYFFALTVPLSMITWFSYQCVFLATLTILILIFTTQAFLRLRFESITKQVQKFHRCKKSDRNRHRLHIKSTINDIVRQFNASNVLFDDLM